MKHRLLALYGIAFNPFRPDVPVEALHATDVLDGFIQRIQFAVADGGFGLITGEPGTGKSVSLRLLNERLENMRDVTVRVITHPQSGLADFYREMGELFGVALRPHNRWSGFRSLRERWFAHIDSTLHRPLLLIDEAQEMSADVLSELRILASAQFDSRNLLGVVLCGDGRLLSKLQRQDLLPVGSRLRTRLLLERASKTELIECLRHLLDAAGGSQLMTTGLIDTITDHAAGNYRALVIMAGELLSAAARREYGSVDEKLFLELYSNAPQHIEPAKPRRGRKRR